MKANIKAKNSVTGLYYRKQTASFDAEYVDATLLTEAQFAVVNYSYENVVRDFATP